MCTKYNLSLSSPKMSSSLIIVKEMSFCHLNDTTQREIAWLYLKCQLEKDFNGVGWLLKRTEGLIDEAKDKLDRQKIIP